MSYLNPKSKKVRCPYWLSMLLWALSGPLGAGPASCGRWKRACLEAIMSGVSIRLFGEVWFSWLNGDWVYDLAPGTSHSGTVVIAALLMCMACALWVNDYWHIKLWHGLKSDPLLDPSTMIE